jgi:O-antigen ligase
MGRFLNSRAVAEPPGPRQYLSPLSGVNAAPLTEPAPPPVVTPKRAAAVNSPVTIVGLYALCIYLIAGYATDLSYRFLGTKPYVSMISGIVVFVCFLVSGQALVALRTTVGKLWLGLGIWMCFSVVFSRWPGGSEAVLQGYIPKQHMVLFYVAAFALTIQRCRTLWRGYALGGFILILSCFFFGAPEPESGRFTIPTNVFLTNPNDLAMELLLCLGFFLFLIRQPAKLGRIAGLVGALGAGFYLLKTGSRGGALAAVILALLSLFFSASRVLVLIGALPAILILFALVPHQIMSRLAVIGFSDSSQSQSMEESKAQDSSNERRHLFIESVKYTLKNPIFGIGPGRFSDAIWEDGKKEGRHEASMGTHNTYTQIGAECGIPALCMFAAAVFVTIRKSFRLYRATRKDPANGVLSAMAFTCFALGVAFAVDVFFHHMAYSSNMAMVMGLWVATENAAVSQGFNR